MRVHARRRAAQQSTRGHLRERVSRRTFLARSGALAVGAMTAPGFLRASTALAASSPAARPNYSAGLTVALGAPVTSLDPAVPTSTLAETVKRSMYEGLVDLDAQGRLGPGLATRWTVSPDGTAWTFSLRPRITFHDGTRFDAPAVKATLDRLRDPKQALPSGYLFDMIESVDVVDPLTARIRTKTPFGAMLPHLASEAALMISPAALDKYGKDIARHPVGTGPYKFASQIPGQSVTVTRFDQYWARRPYLGSVTFTAVSEDATRVAQLETNQAQVIVNVPPSQIERLRSRPNIAVAIGDGNRVAHIGINVQKDPLTDRRLRQALNYAVDRRGLVDGLLNGLGTPSDSFVAPITWGYAAQPVYTYDVAKAKQLLAQAGYPNGFHTTIYTPQGRYPQDKETAVAVQAQFVQIGVQAQVQVIEWARYLDLLRKPVDQNDVHLYLLAWESGTGEIGYVADLVFQSTEWPPKGWNTMFYKNPQVDALITKADGTVDQATRKQLYAEAQRLVVNDAPWVFLFTYKQVLGLRSNVHDLIALPSEAFDLRRTWIG